jgi:hypothetical protein
MILPDQTDLAERYKNIGIVLPPPHRYFIVALSEELRRRTGANIHLFCADDDQVRYMRSVSPPGTFASIVSYGVQYIALEEKVADGDAVMVRAQRIEDRLGVTISLLSMTSRHLGRGYALTGYNHPKSRQSEKSSYVQAVHAITAEAEFWLEHLKTLNIDLLINGGRVIYETARTLGIPYRYMLGARARNLHFWATSCTGDNPRLATMLKNGTITPPAGLVDSPYHSHMTLRKKFIRAVTLTGVARRIVSIVVQHGMHILRRNQKAREYYVRSLIRYQIRRWRDFRKLQRMATVTLETLQGTPYVFFPLQTEPEVSMQWFSPEFFFQHAAIAALSRDLPAGMRLVIKDTYEAIGRRPANFYDQLADFKNVVMLDPLELGIRVVENAEAVATIGSTAGLEAAALGKPVIVFGKHNAYDVLPHVQRVHDLTDLRPALTKALSDTFDREGARRDGMRLMSAIEATSFDMGRYDYIDLKAFGEAEVVAAADSLFTSLADVPIADIPGPAGAH